MARLFLCDLFAELETRRQKLEEVPVTLKHHFLVPILGECFVASMALRLPRPHAKHSAGLRVTGVLRQDCSPDGLNGTIT